MKVFKIVKVFLLIIVTCLCIAYISMFLNRNNFNIESIYDSPYIYRTYFLLSLYYLIILIAMVVIVVSKPKEKIGFIFQLAAIIIVFIGLYILYSRIPLSGSATTIPENQTYGIVRYPINILIPRQIEYASIDGIQVYKISSFVYTLRGFTYMIILWYSILMSFLYKKRTIVIVSSSIALLISVLYVLQYIGF